MREVLNTWRNTCIFFSYLFIFSAWLLFRAPWVIFWEAAPPLLLSRLAECSKSRIQSQWWAWGPEERGSNTRTKELYSPRSRLVLVDQREFGWFLMEAGLCSSTTGTHRACEAGGSSQLSSGFFHWSRACGADVQCHRGAEKSEGGAFPLHSSQSP